MRRVALVVGTVIVAGLAARSATAGDAPARAKAEEEAKRVSRAFADGEAPERDVGSEARRVLEAYVASLPEAKRSDGRLASHALAPLLAKAAWAAGDGEEATRRAGAALAAATKAPPDWDRGNVLHEM